MSARVVSLNKSVYISVRLSVFFLPDAAAADSASPFRRSASMRPVVLRDGD